MTSAPSQEPPADGHVSTGQLPREELVRGLLLDAYERYRDVDDGAVADYIPALAGVLAGPVRRLHRRAPTAGRSPSATPTTAFSIQSVSKPFVFALVCDAIGHDEARRKLGVNSTGLPFNSVMAIELNADRTMNPMVNAGAIATTSLVPGPTAEDKWRVRPRRAVALRRAAPRARRRGLRVRGGDEPAQPGHRPPPRQLRPPLLRPRRGDRRLHPAVLAARDRRRPGRDGRDARRRRRQPAHRRAGRRAGHLQARARRDGDRRALRALRRVAVRHRPARQERRQRRHRHGLAGQGRPRHVLAAARRGRQQRARHAAHHGTCPSASA